MRKYGVIDIGTNTTRLLLAEVQGEIIHTNKFLTTTRIGQDFQNGRLAPEPMERTLEAIADYVNVASAFGAEKIYAFATSAIRAAKNKREFVDAVFSHTGITLDVISGDTEALAGFVGAVGLEKAGTLIDIGGGSTEIISGAKGTVSFSCSLELGGVRLLNTFGEYNPANTDRYINDIDTLLLQSDFYPDEGDLVGVAGTVTTAAAIRYSLAEYQPALVQGAVLSIEYINELLKMLADMDIDSRKKVVGLEPGRTDVICYGMSILSRFMSLYEYDSIVVSDRDNLEGYLTLQFKN